MIKAKSPKASETEATDEPESSEISRKELTELSRLLGIVRHAHKDLVKRRAEAVERYRTLTSELADSVPGWANELSLDDNLKLMRSNKVPDRENAANLIGEYKLFVEAINKETAELKPQAEALLALANSIGRRRAAQLSDAYQSGLRAAVKVLTPFMTEDDDPMGFARIMPILTQTHARIFWQPSATDSINRALSSAVAIQREMEQLIPAFTQA